MSNQFRKKKNAASLNTRLRKYSEWCGVHYYVTLTNSCNLKCRYCYGKACEDFCSDFHGLTVDYSLPSSIAYDTETLSGFVQKDSDSTIILYGGEPLLEIEKLREIMDEVEAGRHVMQTNGLLLDRLESEYVNRFNSILI